MKIHRLALGLGCLLAACGAPPPASSSPEPQIALHLDPPPVHALLGHRAQLDLSTAQIEELDELGQQIHAENHPLLMQLHAIDHHHSNTMARREMMTLAGKVHLNNHRAMERVRNTLSDEQRDGVCTLFPGGQATRALRSTTSSDYALRTVSRPTTYLNVGSHRAASSVWSWCNEAETTTAAR